jgi:hypothetical protein
LAHFGACSVCHRERDNAQNAPPDAEALLHDGVEGGENSSPDVVTPSMPNSTAVPNQQGCSLT